MRTFKKSSSGKDYKVVLLVHFTHKTGTYIAKLQMVHLDYTQ